MRTKRQTTIGWFAAALVIAVTGCGLKTGYAPTEVPVHRQAGRAQAPVRVDSLTVVSWNIQFGEHVAQALAELRAHPRLAAADILLLQEMDPEGSRAIADALGFHLVHGSAAVHPHHGRLFGNAVLSRWPILDDRVVVLPHPTPLTGHRRIAVAADIDLGGGRRLRAVSIHTATVIVDQDDRLEQARAAADSLGIATGPVLIAGDFNTATDYDVDLLRRTMRELDLAQVRLTPGPTIRNRVKKFPGSESVLDHIFVRSLRAGARGVVRSTTASDHYPVWAVLRFENTSQQTAGDPLY